MTWLDYAAVAFALPGGVVTVPRAVLLGFYPDTWDSDRLYRFVADEELSLAALADVEAGAPAEWVARHRGLTTESRSGERGYVSSTGDRVSAVGVGEADPVSVTYLDADGVEVPPDWVRHTAAVAGTPRSA